MKIEIKYFIPVDFTDENAKIIYENKPPVYATIGSAGFDFKSMDNKIIQPFHHAIFRTGLVFDFPSNTVLDIRSRSGLAAKQSIFVLNSPGTIDSDYKKEVGVILYNASDKPLEIQVGDRIAQGVFLPILQANFEVVNSIQDTERGGFGSTGIK